MGGGTQKLEKGDLWERCCHATRLVAKNGKLMMVEKLKLCVKCGAGVEQPATGRPASYCSAGCRRSAAIEIKRLNRRIEKLEERLEDHRGAPDDGPPDFDGNKPPARRALLAEGMKEAEERLRALLDIGEKGPDGVEGAG